MTRVETRAWRVFAASLLVACTACGRPTDRGRLLPEGITRAGRYTLVSVQNLQTSIPPKNKNGTINVVVENPAGTTQRWEVDEKGNKIECRLEGGRPWVLAYLGYPANYGMIPGTVMPKALGGEGDPLDALVLGPSRQRGVIVEARPIGVLKVAEQGRQDDKILAVQPGSVFGGVKDIKALDAEFPGITTIVRTWFEHQKGARRLRVLGFAGPKEARRLIDASKQAFDLGNRKAP